MKNTTPRTAPIAVTILCCLLTVAVASGEPQTGGESEAAPGELSLSWSDGMLTIHGDHLPGGAVEVWYLEAYCRDNSLAADWGEHTVIDHETQKLSASEDGKRIELRDELADGVVAHHTITADEAGVAFRVEIENPTDSASEAHWAQPCIRVGRFTGTGAETTDDKYAYLGESFVFLDGELRRMPTEPWATNARYTPGQVWAAPGVPPSDVNPRPLNPKTPSNGLVGCFSADGDWILATACQPYQELFQGVIRCLHSDFRIGGLEPGETKEIRGRIYVVPNDVDALLARYRADFPEHQRIHPDSDPTPAETGIDPVEPGDAAGIDPDRLGKPRLLFNGRDLDGWKPIMREPGSADRVWSVHDGAIRAEPNGVGYLRYDRSRFRNYVLTLRWRFIEPGNTGLLLRAHGDPQVFGGVWPRSIEAQIHHHRTGDLWNIAEFPMTVDADRTQGRRTVKLHDSSEKPVGEWNTYTLVLDGSELRLLVNGLLQNRASDVEEVAGWIGLQSETAVIEFRDIALWPIVKPAAR